MTSKRIATSPYPSLLVVRGTPDLVPPVAESLHGALLLVLNCRSLRFAAGWLMTAAGGRHPQAELQVVTL